MARKPHRRRQAGIPKPGHPSDCAARCNSMGTAGFDSERLGVLRTNGVSIMMRKIAIGLVAAAIATAGSTLSASAFRGGVASVTALVARTLPEAASAGAALLAAAISDP